MVNDYDVVISPQGNIKGFPDSQGLFEHMISRLAEIGFDVQRLFDGRNRLTVSCAMPEKTVLRPFLPMDATVKIERTQYSCIKRLKSIRYIPENLFYQIKPKNFFRSMMEWLVNGSWNVEANVLVPKYNEITYEIEEKIEPSLETGGHGTRMIRLLKTCNNLHFYIRTDINEVEKLFNNSKMDMGLYQTYGVTELKKIRQWETEQGILLSGFCPADIGKEIYENRSFFKIGAKEGINYIEEGSLIVPRKEYQGRYIKNGNDIFNGKGYLYYI